MRPPASPVSAMGQKRTSSGRSAMSAFLLRADILNVVIALASHWVRLRSTWLNTRRTLSRLKPDSPPICGRRRTTRSIPTEAFDPNICVFWSHVQAGVTDCRMILLNCCANLIARSLIHKEVSMRQVVIGITVTLALAGMLASDAEAAAQCCRLSGRWFCGTMCRGTAAPRCCKQFGRWQCPCPH